jgi:DnaJ domain
MTAARRFEAKPATITRDLLAVVRKMGATNLTVSTSEQVDKGTGTSEIVFDRGGRRYVFRCQKYPDPRDNLRAAQLSISLLYRAMEEYGVVTDEKAKTVEFSRFFQPFEALPDDTVLLLGDGATKWWDLLNVRPNATKADVVGAFRALAHIHHPDVGGDAEMFKRIRKAYEDGIAAVEGH